MVKIGQLSIIYIVSLIISVIQSGLVLMACTGVIRQLYGDILRLPTMNFIVSIHIYIIHIVSVSANNVSQLFLFYMVCVCI